ncbi:hypothetical protein Ngar_c08020 [Candidatus Nitrososphaera gargensis Ga9.2]|uniref:Uncharacterized protein n=1 Tax=Nitrososphaera gargensis (strain Ga9.2) TaxID=1237085 RepID=K0IMB9_NITGG|nr:hypothetical protein [Candidatus Nitrososphaera gargensis]AFU57744.1 hypothetical protein Ngar_c08020 [Candidatus Nitrososphaera gargensis Ga9.2]
MNDSKSVRNEILHLVALIRDLRATLLQEKQSDVSVSSSLLPLGSRTEANIDITIQILDIAERVVDTYTRLKDYRDAEFKILARPTLFWPDGRSLGFGFAAHMCVE